MAILLIASCGPVSIVDQTTRPEPDRTPFPTPATETLQVTGTTASGNRLRIIIPALALEFRPPDTPVQVFVALVDPQGTYSYLLYPANRRGENIDRFDLSDYPIEVGVSETTSYVALWAVAYHLSGTTAAAAQGWDALATSLALSFRAWLNAGEPTDDPLAGAVCASDGSLYAWFAEMEVVGQAMTVIERTEGWDRDVSTMSAGDGSLSAVFDVDYLAAADSTPPADSAQPTNDPLPAEPTTEPASGVYSLVMEETFDDPASGGRWYLSRTRAYINEIAGSAYQIRLLETTRPPAAQSWGSLAGVRIRRGLIEAEMRLTEGDPDDAQLGLWLHYQDDDNFLYVGLSNRGEYRVAVVQNNRVQRVIQNWQLHPAINTGAAINRLAVEIGPEGRHDLLVNDTPLLTFRDQTFSEGGLAFFCAARTVPATCRLESLRIWQPLT